MNKLLPFLVTIYCRCGIWLLEFVERRKSAHNQLLSTKASRMAPPPPSFNSFPDLSKSKLPPPAFDSFPSTSTSTDTSRRAPSPSASTTTSKRPRAAEFLEGLEKELQGRGATGIIKREGGHRESEERSSKSKGKERARDRDSDRYRAKDSKRTKDDKEKKSRKRDHEELGSLGMMGAGGELEVVRGGDYGGKVSLCSPWIPVLDD